MAIFVVWTSQVRNLGYYRSQQLTSTAAALSQARISIDYSSFIPKESATIRKNLTWVKILRRKYALQDYFLRIEICLKSANLSFYKSYISSKFNIIEYNSNLKKLSTQKKNIKKIIRIWMILLVSLCSRVSRSWQLLSASPWRKHPPCAYQWQQEHANITATPKLWL